MKKLEHNSQKEHNKNTVRHDESDNSSHTTESHSHVSHSNHVSQSSHAEHNHHDNHEKDDNHGDHSEHDHSSHAEVFRRKFWVSLILALPIFVISPFMGIELPFQPSFPGSEWLVFVLASILFFYGGMSFIKGAVSEFKERSPGMMALISLGISVAYFYSVYAFIMNHIIKSDEMLMDFFWELASLIVIMLLGHWIEMKAVGNAGSALDELNKLLPNSAFRVTESGDTVEVSIDEIKVGDKLRVRASDRIPADGVIIEGSTQVNESMVTGESREVEKEEGDNLIGGSINGSGTILIEVTGTGDTGYLAKVKKMVYDAQADQSHAETLANRVAKWLFYIAIAIGLSSFILWYVIRNDFDFSLLRLVTVLIIACPHALGLAIPLVVARSTSIAAKNGLIIRDRNTTELVQDIDVVFMDKTGTLTEGNFKVNHYESYVDSLTDKEMLGIVAALETSSSHPLARGIIEHAKEENISFKDADNVNNIPGVGLEGNVDEQTYRVVNGKYLSRENIEYDNNEFDSLSKSGNSISYLINSKNEVLGIVAQGDQIKPESHDFIKYLNDHNIKSVILTGDNRQVAKSVAKELGIGEYHAELLPEDKEKIIRDYQSKGQKVLMVGDGVNDAPSLARADIGVAIGAGTDVAIDSAGVVLVKSNPKDLVNFFNISHSTTRKMKQNLWWGAGYNIIALPLAAGVLAPMGIILAPSVGAIIMSLSTVIVALNAMTLKLD